MIESKRSSCSFDHGSIVSLATKRHKIDISIFPKDRKEKFGEQISALQQLVSPYGKPEGVKTLYHRVCVNTDTASVLLVAIEYIQFLHEQVKVLSAPYLQSAPAVVMQVSWEVVKKRFSRIAVMNAGIRALQQFARQRVMSGTNLLHDGSRGKQWRGSLDAHENHFSQVPMTWQPAF